MLHHHFLKLPLGAKPLEARGEAASILYNKDLSKTSCVTIGSKDPWVVFKRPVVATDERNSMEFLILVLIHI